MSYCCDINSLPFEKDDPELEEKIKRMYTMNGVIPEVTVYEDRNCWINLDLDAEEKQRYELEAIRGLIELNYFAEATQEITYYRNAYPFETDGMYQEAYLAYVQGNINDALSKCLSIIRDAPRHADTLALAGTILWSNGDIDMAKWYYKKVVSIDAFEAQSYIRDVL